MIPPTVFPLKTNDPVVVTEEPKFGKITENKDGTITYTPNSTGPTSIIDSVSFKYTNLFGTTLIVRKSFVVQQNGDVPSIIQTGDVQNSKNIKWLYLIFLLPMFFVRRVNRRIIASLSIIALALVATSTFNIAPATAANCKPVKPTGTTVGKIQVNSVDMPIKSFNYPKGGVMEPQASTMMAALSDRHMPLSSQLGTSVIVWHRNYNGCENQLNTFFLKDIGSTFKITDENGRVTTYVIDKKFTVKKGSYKSNWFTLVGPRQLTLATCTGAFKAGHYVDNLVIIATPK